MKLGMQPWRAKEGHESIWTLDLRFADLCLHVCNYVKDLGMSLLGLDLYRKCGKPRTFNT